ncbi:MAG: M28 family peptidase [Acidobacteriota bacterium]
MSVDRAIIYHQEVATNMIDLAKSCEVKVEVKRASKPILISILFFALIAASATVGAFNLPLVPSEGMASISARDLRMHLSFLASHELGGRYTFSTGNRIAARYLASQLESFGYRGGARDGGYLQRIDFALNILDRKTSRLEVSDTKATKEFLFGEDFFVPYPTALNLKAEAVFVGYGISAPKKGYDNYAGLDVKDKIVLIALGRPTSLQTTALDEVEQGLAAAAAHGAQAALYLPAQINGVPWGPYDLVEEDEDRLKMIGEQTSKRDENDEQMPALPYVYISPTVAERLLSSIDLQLETFVKASVAGEPLKPSPLPVQLKLQVVIQEIRQQAQNVVGIYEGSDAKLKNEYILLSAHYDHLKSKGEIVYHGADDDGSGTSAVLAIARAFTQGPRPKRSVLIVFHTGEELGLYGSRYFTNVEPLVPLESIVANLNVDMIGRSRVAGRNSPQDSGLTDKDSIYLIGSDKHSSELHQISEQTNQELTNLRLDYAYNSEDHPLKLYYRSDHYNYGRKGIPVIFYFTGIHADYHKPTDTVDKIDFEKMVRITRLIYATAWRVANLDHRLVTDRVQKK